MVKCKKNVVDKSKIRVGEPLLDLFEAAARTSVVRFT
jgi:hypothetical protein